MRSAFRLLACFLSAAILATCTGGLAWGDWDEGDGHKMHFPQLPDPNGWDVRISNARNPLEWVVADDWMCSETGPVSDVHFWGSWEGDRPDEISSIHLSIHSNKPADPTDDTSYSMPDVLLWEQDFSSQQFVVRFGGSGQQGWYDPVFDEYEEDNHDDYFQVNITDIFTPFVQQKDEIYWLDISVDLEGEDEVGKLGWKTSQNHWEDDAVYQDPISKEWKELFDPVSGESLDMAFVINVPEPSTCVLLSIGLLGMLVMTRRARS